MSTRGTIAFIFSENGRYYLAASKEFVGGMDPGMNRANFLLDCFDEYFYSKRIHSSGKSKMHSLLHKFAKLIKEDLGNREDFKYYELPWNPSKTKIVLDLLSKKDKNGNMMFDNDFLANALHYSDWIYLMPLCDMKNVDIRCEEDDINGSIYTASSLKRGELQIFHYRDLRYSYSGNELVELCGEFRTFPKEEISELDGKRFDKYGAEIDKDGNPVDETDAEFKREYRELPLDDNESKHNSEDIFINGNGCVQFKEYVEIIDQYHDGDLDCLVVRTADNKHAIFKEMK